MTLARTALATLLLAGSALSAQDVRYGLHGHLSFPQGDMKDVGIDTVGIGFGGHATFAFNQHVIRPRIDHTFFPEAEKFGVKRKLTGLSVGADYMYFLEGQDKGFYLTGGAAATRWNIKSKFGGSSSSYPTTRLTLAAGVGYQWTKDFGTEVRYVTSSFDARIDANTITLAATYRF